VSDDEDRGVKYDSQVSALKMVAFIKIGTTGRADLEGKDNFTVRSTEYVPNVTAKWKCPSGS